MRFGLLVVSLLLSSSALAQKQLAIVNLRVDLPDAERAQARATIENAVKKAGLELIPEMQVQYLQTTAPELFNCFVEDRCRIDLGQRLLAAYLLTGSIGKEGDAYVMQLD